MPDLACQEMLVACSSGVLSAQDILTLVNSPGVQAALQAAPVIYGGDSRPVDGTVFRIQIGTAIIDVGSPCNGSAGCVDIPPNVAALADMLKSIDSQELGSAPCSTVFQGP